MLVKGRIMKNQGRFGDQEGSVGGIGNLFALVAASYTLGSTSTPFRKGKGKDKMGPNTRVRKDRRHR